MENLQTEHHVISHLEIDHKRIAQDIKNAPGINEILRWIREEQPVQEDLQLMHSAIKRLRLGRHPSSEAECVQAAFARGAGKALCFAVQHRNGSSGLKAKRSARMGSLKARTYATNKTIW